MTLPAPDQATSAIAQRVKELRRRKGWSGRQLAEAMADAGVRWDRAVVANLENGRRGSITAEELLALAVVLDVAPVHLLVPPDLQGHNTYPVTPTRGEPATEVRAWIRGEKPLATQDRRIYLTEVPESELGLHT